MKKYCNEDEEQGVRAWVDIRSNLHLMESQEKRGREQGRRNI